MVVLDLDGFNSRGRSARSHFAARVRLRVQGTMRLQFHIRNGGPVCGGVQADTHVSDRRVEATARPPGGLDALL